MNDHWHNMWTVYQHDLLAVALISLAVVMWVVWRTTRG